jgi:diaminopimelate decarboxylase
MTEQIEKLPIFPLTTKVNRQGNLEIGGCDTVQLARKYGTPLYIYDELTLLEKCREFKKEFGTRYPTTINYSCKAFINRAVLHLFAGEGLGLDVVSGGEIGIAAAFGFPVERIDFPGNNKSAEELTFALKTGIGHVVVDNFHELEMLRKIARKLRKKQKILLRLSPGVEPHTHRYVITGNTDSKFGIPIEQGEKAITDAMSMPELELTGLHFHIGSQIKETEPYVQAIGGFLDFAADMKKKHGFKLSEMSIGGGYAHRYLLEEPVPSLTEYAETLTGAIISKCLELGLVRPHLIIEPGRSMVAGAGVALYTTGAVKDIPGVRHYISIDGGMADNIRPAMYQAKLDAVIANKMNAKNTRTVSISGKYCESSDILIKDIILPEITAGDILAVPGCGAYNITESMNYNASFRPAVVMVKDGTASLIRRRENLEDLMRCDLVE